MSEKKINETTTSATPAAGVTSFPAVTFEGMKEGQVIILDFEDCEICPCCGSMIPKKK